MALKQAAKWVGGIGVAGVVLLMVSFFVAGRQLDPPFEQAVLEPITIPAGEPLAGASLLFDSDATGNYEVYVRLGADGARVPLTADGQFDSWRARLSPDRRTVLFYRTPAGVHDGDLAQAGLWMVAASGGEPVEVLPPRAHGWTVQGQAEWAPTGESLTMMGGRPQGEQVWITSTDGRDIRAVATEPGDNSYPSWSRDLKRILYVGCPKAPCEPNERELFVVLTATGVRTQLTSDDLLDEDPHFSPDGRTIVMRTQFAAPDEDGDGEIWDIRVMPTNRSVPPRRIVDATSVSAMPQWLDDDTVVFQLNGDLVAVDITDPSSVMLLEQTPADEAYPSS